MPGSKIAGVGKAFGRKFVEAVLAEGKYDTITNRLSRIAFEAFKDAYDRGDKRAEFEFRVGNPDYDEVDIESTQFEFDFMGVVNFTEDTYKVDGGANAGFDDDGEEIQPMINVNFQIPKNPDWQEVSMDLKDVVRHELEHLTQDGENIRTGKYIPDTGDGNPGRGTTDFLISNFFFFTVNSDTATTGGIKGGGYGCSVGPITIEG